MLRPGASAEHLVVISGSESELHGVGHLEPSPEEASRPGIGPDSCSPRPVRVGSSSARGGKRRPGPPNLIHFDRARPKPSCATCRCTMTQAGRRTQPAIALGGGTWMDSQNLPQSRPSFTPAPQRAHSGTHTPTHNPRPRIGGEFSSLRIAPNSRELRLDATTKRPAGGVPCTKTHTHRLQLSGTHTR